MSTHSTSITAQCVAAEVRGILAAKRLSAAWLAERIGVKQAYFSIRMRDLRPLTLDELDAIAGAFEVDPEQLLAEAIKNHYDHIQAKSNRP